MTSYFFTKGNIVHKINERLIFNIRRRIENAKRTFICENDIALFVHCNNALRYVFQNRIQFVVFFGYFAYMSVRFRSVR